MDKEQQLRELQTAIQEESAIHVGFHSDVISEIIKLEPMYLMEVLERAGEPLTDLAKKEDWAMFQNVFVTEAIGVMDYKDFSKVAKHFFSYRQTEEEILAENVEITREYYLELQAKSKELHELKYHTPSLEERVEQFTTMTTASGNEVIGYDPITDQIALLPSWEHNYTEPYFEEGLILDYTSSKSDIEQFVLYLEEHTSLAFKDAIVERFDERTREFYDEYLEYEDTFADWAWCMEQYLCEGIDGKLEKVNQLLAETENVEIIPYTARGYCQGDVWNLYYFWDKTEEADNTREQIEDYLEHEIGAYYRGSLTELEIYDKDEEIIDSFIVDREIFWDESIQQVRELTGVGTYMEVESALALMDVNIPITEEVILEFNALDKREQIAYIEHYEDRQLDHEKSL